MKKFMLFLCATCASLASFADPSNTLLTGFAARFPGVESVQWSETNSGYMAYYKTTADVTVRVFYDKRERFQYVAKTYGQSLLPDNMKRVLKNEYRGFKVNSVTECSNETGTNYYVLLESKKKICRVRYTGDGEESQILERFNVAPAE